MKHHRKERIGSLIQEELGKIIQKEVEFDRAVVTIVDVSVSDDLEDAIVKLGVFPPEKGPDVLLGLVKARPRLQFLLHRKLNIRPMQKIIFQLAQ